MNPKAVFEVLKKISHRKVGATAEALPRCGNGDGYFQTLAINKEYTPV